MPDLKKVIKGLELCLGSIDSAGCPEGCPYYEACQKYENLVVFQPVMRDALEALKAQEPRWISVKDRLPEEGVLVLVAFDVDFGLGETRQVDTAMCQEGVFCGGGLDNYLAFPCEVDVTHWTPLPEPPKEES